VRKVCVCVMLIMEHIFQKLSKEDCLECVKLLETHFKLKFLSYSGSLYAESLKITNQPTQSYVRFEVFTAVPVKNAIFRNVMPHGSCKN
jgi:hypothetical protein